MSAQKPVDVDALRDIATYLINAGGLADGRAVALCAGELIEHRARSAAVKRNERLIAAASALVCPPLRYVSGRIEIDCSDHATAMALVGELRAALADARGDAA